MNKNNTAELSAFDLLLPIMQEEIHKSFTTPTLIQQKAIKEILAGKNVLLIAPTGTGKTEAAIFPVFNLLLTLKEKKIENPGISILYITPLRALNRDIFQRIVELGKNLEITVEIRHGDTNASTRRKQAVHPPDMLIVTPETLQAILPGKRIREHLRKIKCVIVDEIHEIVDSKRGSQLSIGLERLRELTGQDFQRIGLSATIGSPQIVANFLRGAGSSVEIIRAAIEKELEITVESPMPQPEDQNVAKKLQLTPDSVTRIQRIIDIVKAHQSVLIFVNTRQQAELLTARMKLFQPPFSFAVHHGSLSKEVRIESEQRFKENLKCIICTSSLELGIDIGSIDYIIQFMSPRQVTRLTQRIGRSGHQIGRISQGTVICLNEIDDICESITIARNTLSGNLEQIQVHENSLDTLAHQIIGILLDKRTTTIDEIYNIVIRAYPFHNLKKDLFVETINQLESQRLLSLRENGMLQNRSGNLLHYYSLLTMIPDIQQYKIIDIAQNRPIGTLDEEFVSEHCKPNSIFIIRGTPWKILAVNEEKIEVVEIQDWTSAIPSWVGELIPVPYTIAQEVGQLRAQISDALRKNEDPYPILDPYTLNKPTKEVIIETLKAHFKNKIPIPTHDKVFIEELEKNIVIHACFGTRVNETLSRIIAALLSSRLGSTIGVRVDPYRIVLSLPRIIDLHEIPEILFKVDDNYVKAILDITLKRSSMFKYRFFHVAKYFGIIKKGARYRDINILRLIRIFKNTPVYQETMRTVQMEKLDLSATLDVLNRIKKNEIDVQILFKDNLKPSPLAVQALQWVSPRDLITPERSEYQIQQVIRERILNRQIKLVCLYCRKYSSFKTIKLLPEKPECPKCTSRFLAVLPIEGINIHRVMNLKEKGKKLSEEDTQIYERAQKSANLVLSYGKKAIIAMAAYGVGPTTAMRILAKPYKSDTEFFQAIIEAEKQYVKTRPFWNKK